MSTTMAVLSSRTRSNSPTLYRHCHYSPTAAPAKLKPISSPILCRSPPTPRSVRLSVHRDRSASPRSRISPAKSWRSHGVVPASDERRNKKACLCSPTTHPGSFRCSMHKNQTRGQDQTAPWSSLSVRRSAMTNSLVRIGAVEGDFVKRALSAPIKPSSHSQRRRAAFQPRPSRLSVVSRAGEDS